MFTLLIVNYPDREENLDLEFVSYDALEKYIYTKCPGWTSVVVTIVNLSRKEPK